MRSVRCARRFRRLRLQPDRQIFISISIRLFLTRLVIGSSLFLIRVHPLTFSTAYPVPSWDRNSCSIVEQWKWKWRCRRKREERKEEDVLEKKNWQVRENHRSRIKSHQLLYPGVPGTAPLAAAAASLCFLFTRKLWNRKVSLSTRIQRSLFPSSISIIVHHRTDKYQRDIRILSKLDSISSRVYFSPPFIFFIILSFDIISLWTNSLWLSPSAMKVIYTREWDYSDTNYGVFDPHSYTWSRCFTSVEAIALWSCLSFFLNASSLSFSLLCSSSCFCCSQSYDKKRRKQRNVR